MESLEFRDFSRLQASPCTAREDFERSKACPFVPRQVR